MADPAPGYPRRSEEPHCYNCGGPGHWAIACPEPTRQTPAGYEAWKNASHSTQRGGRDHGRGGNKRSNGPIITRYGPPATQDPTHLTPSGYNPPPPVPYSAPQPQYTAPPPPPQPQNPLPQNPLPQAHHYPHYPPAPQYPPTRYPPTYAPSASPPPPPPPQIYRPSPPGQIPPGHHLPHIPPPGTPSRPPPTVQDYPGHFHSPIPASPYSQPYSHYLPIPPPLHSRSHHLPKPPNHSSPPKPDHFAGRSRQQRSGGGPNSRNQPRPPPQSSPLIPPTVSGEGLMHALPPKPPPTNNEQPDRRRDQRNKKKHDRQKGNRDNRQNGGGNNRRNSSHKKQNQSNKNNNSPRARKKFKDGISTEDGKSVTANEASSTKSELEDKSDRASAVTKTPEHDRTEEQNPVEENPGDQDHKESHDQERHDDSRVTEPEPHLDEATESSVNADAKNSPLHPKDGSVPETAAAEAHESSAKALPEAEQGQASEHDSGSAQQPKLSADKSSAQQGSSEEAKVEVPEAPEESPDRQQAGRKHGRTDEDEDENEESAVDRRTKRVKHEDDMPPHRNASGNPPGHTLPSTESPRLGETHRASQSNGPPSSDDVDLPALEGKLSSARRDSTSGGSQPGSRRSSISSRSSGLDSLEAELLGLPSKEKSRAESRSEKRGSDGRGNGKKRRPKVDSAYSRRW